MSVLRKELQVPMLPKKYPLICVVIVISLCVIWGVEACPPGCTCTTLKAKDDKSGETPRIGRGRKVNCAENLSPITSADQIKSLPLDTVIIDLSKNAITVLRRASFNRLSMLRKLDLSNNQISLIEAGAFEGLQKLEKLDLSYNNIGSVNTSMFTGMSSLQKMSLSFNKINTIPEGTFSDLISLRKIDFKSDYLRCDCHLRWIAKWMKEKNVRIQSSTTCAVPQELKDRPVKGLKKKELHCDRPLELPLFEITPSKSQVVFEGDKIPFECQASVVDDNMHMFWVRKGGVVTTNRSAGIFVHTYPSQDRTMMTHRLLLNNLGKDDTGIWQCMVTTPQGNVSDDINIVVISSSALYCVAITSKTERGIYKWPKTVAGVRSELPCKRGQDRLATYDCTPEGHWRDLNVDRCEFTSDTTRKLQSLGESLTDSLLGNSSGLLRTMRNLQKLVVIPNHMSFSTDLTLVSRALARMAPYAYQQEELADVLLNIVSLLLNLPASMFLSEQKASRACTRLVNIVEGIPHQQLSRRANITKYSENIALEARTVSVEHFTGMTCLAYTSIFSCQNGIINTSASFTKKQNNLQGSIQLPRSLLNSSGELDSDTLHLQFILYKETKLFPITTPFHDDPAIGNHSRIAIVSSVLSANVSTPIKNLTEPIVLYFKTQRPSKNLVAAYWDFEANGGYGDWRTDGCQIIPDPNVTVVHCFHLSIFTILEVNSSSELDRGMMSGTLHLLPYPVYVGSCICLICLMAVIITYVSCFRFINVPKKLKHSVINICISILLLLIGFTMGVKRTDHHLACQIVGVGIHYLTLVAMFWITVTSYNMLKKFNKVNKPPAPPPEPVAMPLPPKPMLRFYLLAWGVPLIVCGITVAVSIDHYSEPDYCFLSWDPSIGAFYSPTGLLVVFNLIFFLRISRVIHKTTNNLNETDNTEEVNDIELTQSPDDGTTEIQALTSTRRPPEEDTESIASSVMDMERQPITQLYAVVAMLFLYILFYTCAGFAVAQPFKSIIPHQELIFSYLYGLTSSAFGIFMLVYFCLTRKDSCSSWRRFFFCDQNPVYDVNYQGSNHVALSNGHVVHANNDVDMENKNYNITQEVTDGPVKQSNINLIPAPPFLSDRESSVTGPPDPNNVPSFYNPKQNGIAKKFWDRQRHHSKLITKEMTKDLNGSGTDYFSGSEANHRGNTSDINTLMSIEIQIQPNGINGRSNGVSPPASSLPLSQQNLYPTQLLLPAIKGSSGLIPKFSMLPLDRNIIPPVGGSVSPITVTTSPCCSTVSYTGSQVAPAHGRSPSACSLGMRPYPSAFTPVAPRNNTLPKQGKNPTPQNNATSTSPTQDYMMRNGSVPRLRDFDGQSQISDVCPREKQWGMQVTNNYLNNNHNNNQAAPGYDPLSRISPQQQQVGCTYKQYGSVDEHITSERPPPAYHFSRARSSSGGYSSDTSGRIQRKHEQSFLQEVHQRIPSDNNKKAVQDLNHTQSPPPLPPHNKSPVTSDLCNNTKVFTTHDSDSQIHVRRSRGNDSDHNSEPTSQASHRRRHRSHDPQHRHSKHHKQSAKKQHSSSAEWEGTPRPKMIPYAYVNYHYHDRVRQKLQRKHGAFPQLMEDSSSSSDSEGLDDIWVMQDKNKNKKETSV
ncbi:adhesion G protein-coupled receptor A3-like [Ylistrum balloti]|uniref:adhesion G protein-coupled receptor A3-like n=1 Tax=Ylistrum balloti TaxID=509963 RepID=UPI0029057F41|nr:adhesion G protein-coupled receptor A3-like [Ylistrum balloti]